MSLVLFFVNIMRYGFNLSIVRVVSKNREDSKYISRVFNQVFSVKLFLFLFLTMFFALLTFTIPAFKAHKTLCFYASLLLLVDLFSVRWFFYGMEKMKYLTLISLIGNSVYVLLVVFFVKVESDFIRIPLYEAIGLGITTVTAFLLVFKKYKFNFRLLSVKDIVEYLKRYFSSFLNLLLPSVYNLIILFVLGLIGIPSYVAFLQIGVKFTSVFSAGNTILTDAFYPAINREKEKWSQMQVVLLAFGVATSVLMFFSSEFLIDVWLKLEESEDVDTIIQVSRFLAVIPFVMSVVSIYGVNGLVIIEKDKLYSKITLFSVCLSLISMFVFVPFIGVYGAVVAILTGRISYAMLAYFFYTKSLENGI